MLVRSYFLLLFLLVNTITSATDYYISSTGSDNNIGTSAITPWETISKVNSVLSSLNPGDRILFKRGDIFYGTLNLGIRGSSDYPILIGAYGTGDNPLITGLTLISEWVNEGGGIYSSSISCESSLSLVLFDGLNTAMGRYPDSGWMTIDSHITNQSLSDSDLDAALTNWTGAEVVIRVNNYTINHLPITNHTNQTLNFSSRTAYNLMDGYGYFIQNDLKTLDKFKEWYYDGQKIYIYFGTENPTDHIVQIGTLDNAINIRNSSYLTLDNISITGFNKNSFTLVRSPYITIQNCKITLCGGNGIEGRGSVAGASSFLKCINNIIDNINNNGIILDSEFTNVLISKNTISNIGLIHGTGYAQDIQSSKGIYINPGLARNSNSVISYNNIINIGYNAIEFAGTNVSVVNNFVSDFCLKKNEGGGIYTYDDSTNDLRSCSILGNIVLYGIGDISGTTYKDYYSVMAIHCDGYSNGIKVIGNTLAYCTNNGNSGYFQNSNVGGVVTDNTFFNNKEQIKINSSPILNGADKLLLKRNIAFSKDKLQGCLYYVGETLLTKTAILDSNYYARPTYDTDVIHTYINSNYKNYTLAGWQNYSGQDSHSFKSPISISNTNDIMFDYNASTTSKSVEIANPMIDVKGIKYRDKIVLSPYSSIILMVDPNPNQPEIPLFLSSTISDLAPDKLEIIYNLSLANEIPETSAFTVKVNSDPRAVNSVSISGKRVILFLSSPVMYGDNVTVTYTKPSTKSIKSTEWVEAESIIEQEVINQVTEEADNVWMKIYPNPAHDLINILIQKPLLVQSFIKIANFLGAMVLEYKINTDNKEFKISSSFASGIYIVQLYANGKIYDTQKLIIIKE